MNKVNVETNPASRASVVKRFVMWFTPHIQQWAIIYVMASYGIFVITNLTYLKIDMGDPYGIAMILIGFFWLGIIGIFKILNMKLDT